jgi:hypothetical protein
MRLVCAGLLVLSAGCGGGQPTAEVRGAVTLDGKPLEAGTLAFFSVKGDVSNASCDIKDGRYAARVPVGLMQVKIYSPKVVGQTPLYPHDPKSPTRPVSVESVPAKYNEQTTLELDVKPGSNDKDFELQSK